MHTVGRVVNFLLDRDVRLMFLGGGKKKKRSLRMIRCESSFHTHLMVLNLGGSKITANLNVREKRGVSKKHTYTFILSIVSTTTNSSSHPTWLVESREVLLDDGHHATTHSC